MKRRPYPLLICCLGFWSLYTLYLVFSGTKLPGTDVFIFKEAGLNLALKGRFVVSNLPFMPYNQEYTYYFYPPLYPFLYGVWTKITGFGYSQGVLFDCLIRLLRTGLILVFLWRPFKSSPKVASSVFLLCLLLLSFITSDGDRPDDLGAVFGLVSWYYLFKQGTRFKVLCGVFLGLAAGTSPAAGAFFTIGVLAFLWPWFKNTKCIFIVGLVSLVMFLLVNAPVFLNEPELLNLFSRQASKTNFSQMYDFEGWSHLGSFLTSWFYRFVTCLKTAPSTTLSALTLLFASGWIVKSECKEARLRTFFAAGLMQFLLVVVVWLMQPYYLWFSFLSLFIFVGQKALKEGLASRLLMFLLCLSLLPKTYEEAKWFFVSLQVPKEESVEPMSKTLSQYIPAGVRVAVTTDQFYTLDRKYRVSNVSHVCVHVEDTDFIYLSRMSDTSQMTPIPIPCLNRAACFEIVASTSQNKHLKLFGKELNYFTRSSGGTLYKNTRCLGKIIPWDVTAEDWLQKNSQ